MKKYSPSKKSLHIIKVLLFLLSAILTLLCIVFIDAYPILMWICIVLCWFLYIIFGLICSSVYFKRTYYYISSNEIAKRSGIIYESKQLIKVKSIQYVTKISTPLSSFTGFNFLKLNALGGSVLILFLSKNDAEEIINHLSAVIKSNYDN